MIDGSHVDTSMRLVSWPGVAAPGWRFNSESPWCTIGPQARPCNPPRVIILRQMSGITVPTFPPVTPQKTENKNTAQFSHLRALGCEY